jgi:hypothetical protein
MQNTMTRALQYDPPFDPQHHRLPDWLARMPSETSEDAGFSSGAALAMLDLAQTTPSLPQALWRARLALRAAAHSVHLTGRAEREAALRDILCLLRPGEQPGPAGEVGLTWHRATTRPLSNASLQRALPGLSTLQAGLWGAAGQGNPVAQAAQVIEAIVIDVPRNDLNALILADAALARALGWTHLVPLLGAGLQRRDLKLRGADLRLACHRALVKSVGRALPLATDLTRRAVQLQAAAPKLRTKQALRAVEMFLTRDAIAPSALAALMSDRAARRLCDRLVTLGAVRELTGRDTFRLYGL